MTAHRPLSARLNLESLEERMVPTTAFLINSTLQIYGTDSSETIKVTVSGNKLAITGVSKKFDVGSVTDIKVDARGGNDLIDVWYSGKKSWVLGGSGHDTIHGTSMDDILVGGSGNDVLFGWAGDDYLSGDGDHDRLFGGSGLDALYGGDGNDFLDDGHRGRQEASDFVVNGGSGNDWDADMIAVNGFHRDDVRQGGAPTCGFLATLSGLAIRGHDFSKHISYAGYTSKGVPQYDVSFLRNGKWVKTRVDFDGSRLSTDPWNAAEGESWVIILHRAWLKFNGNQGRAWSESSLYALGRTMSDVRTTIKDSDFADMAKALKDKRVVIASTFKTPPKGTTLQNTLVSDHAYTVLAVEGSGSSRRVLVRNPWGYDTAKYGDGSRLDGQVWVSWSNFKTQFNHLILS